MAYVKFYRGLEANLPAAGASGLTEGAFYLTTDTWRLYNVINENDTLTLRPLGEKINMIQEINSLPSASDHIGQFAYVASGNIFAVSITDGNSAKWVQINQQAADRSVQSLSTAVAAANDVATVTLTATKGGGATPSTNFKIAAGSGIDVTSSANDTVTISKTATPLTLNPDNGDEHALAVDNGKVSLVAGSNITLSDDTVNGTITITGDAGGVGNVNIDPVANSGNGFTVEVVGSNGHGASDTLDPTITLGNNSGTSYHFVDGNLNLPVYTKTEIDNSLTGLNAMVYRGTLGTGGTTTTVPTSVQIGDTYKVVSDISVTTDGGTVTAEAGDLVIARGTEGADGKITAGSLVWDVVRGADDVDTTYNLHAINNGTELVAKGGAKVGQITVNGDGTYLTATDSKSGTGEINNAITISHALITQDADVAETAVTQTKGNNATYTAVSDVLVDGAGHVTGLKTKELTVVDTKLKANGLTVTAPVAINSGVVTVTPTVALEDTAGTQLSSNAPFSLSSTGTTIQLSVNNSNINADIVWGTF